LSGDAECAVQSAATQSGIDSYLARQSPADKLKYIRALADRDEIVVMIGDGINDAPVLAGATVSIAMGGASALAHASSDILLVRDSLHALPEVVDIARRTAKNVRQNLVWAAAYNFVALPLAALGFVPPWLAAIGMSLSSMLVVLNALRLAPPVKRANKRIDALDIPNDAAPARGA
jgi:Cu2+-exporting ATPase